MNLLIVEDNIHMRETIKKNLKRIDTQSIHECNNGEEAIELYEKIHPDWVLMDIEMEPVDGLSASKAIMKLHPEAKIIIVTNYDDAAYRQAAKKAGVVAYLLKENLWKISELISTKEDV